MAMGWESIDGGRRVGEMGGTTPLGQPGKGRDISHLIPLPGPTKPHSQVDGSPIKHPPLSGAVGCPYGASLQRLVPVGSRGSMFAGKASCCCY